MKASFEPTSSILRVWRNDDAEYGDPYEWSATVRHYSPESIEIAGNTQSLTPSLCKAIVRECVRLGITRILAVTYRNGVRREKWIEIPPAGTNRWKFVLG